MTRFVVSIVGVFAAIAAGFLRPSGGHVVEDLKSPAAMAEWIAIAPKATCEALEPLAARRTKSGIRSAAIIPIEAIRAGYPGVDLTRAISAFTQGMRAKGGARFLFLVGDATTIPPGRAQVGAASPCATDAVYADADDDQVPDRAVGRLPVSDPELVRQFADRVVAYEEDARPAGWRSRISFLAASGGFGAAIDGPLDAAVSALLDRELPASFDLRVLRPDAGSVYGVPRTREKDAMRDLWESGSLVFLYAGHGSRNGLHTADIGRYTRTIFTSFDAGKLAIRSGAPFVMMFACNTTEFQAGTAAPPRDDSERAKHVPSCLGEALLLNPKGAIAVLGASEVSHPYPDLLLAHAMNDIFRSAPRTPIGEMVREAKARVSRAGGEFQEKVDTVAGLFGITESKRRELSELELSLYNLLGDPALVLRAPEIVADVKTAASAAPGETIDVEVRASAPDGATVVVSLESSRSAKPRKAGYPAANDRKLDQLVGAISGGRFQGKFEIPKNITGRRLIVRADVRTDSSQGAGAAAVALEAK